MKRPVEQLLESLREGRVLTVKLLDVNLDQVLDERETEPFEKEWLRVHQSLAPHRSSLGGDDAALVEKVAEVAYRGTFALSANPEIAGSVSDDFDILALALVSGYEDPWLNALWLSFRSGRLPRGYLEPVSGNLGDLIL